MGLHGHAWTTWFYLIGLNLLFLGNLNGSCPFLLDQRIWQNHTTPLFYIIRRVFPRPSQRATSMRVRHEAKTMRLPSASRPGAEQKRVLQKKRRRDAAGPHVEGGSSWIRSEGWTQIMWSTTLQFMWRDMDMEQFPRLNLFRIHS